MDVSRSNRIALIAIVLQLCACAAHSSAPGQSGHDQSAQGNERGSKHGVSTAVATTVCFQRSRHIVRDLVSAMAQLSVLRPANTTLNVARPRSRFDSMLLEGARQAGYALRQQQAVESTGKGIVLSHSVHTDAPVDFGDNTLQGVYFFTLTAGDVALRRAYRVSATGVRPASSLFVRGADASEVLIQDAGFGADPPCLYAEVLPARVVSWQSHPR